MKRNVQKSAQEWSSLVSGYESGNEAEDVYCSRHGVKVSTFRKWRYRVGGDKTYL